MVPEGIPVFPLNVVLYPGGILPLKIFEARYLDMVSECLRNNKGFGVCLIKSGREVGEAATCEDTGTYARIIDWDRSSNGLLGITIQGEQRFRILQSQVLENNLIMGTVDWLAKEVEVELQPRYLVLQGMVADLIMKYQLPFSTDPGRLNDAVWLSYRLAEILPISLNRKQKLLVMDDSNERMDKLHHWISQLDQNSMLA